MGHAIFKENPDKVVSTKNLALQLQEQCANRAVENFKQAQLLCLCVHTHHFAIVVPNDKWKSKTGVTPTALSLESLWHKKEFNDIKLLKLFVESKKI